MQESQNCKYVLMTPPQLKDNGALAGNAAVDTAGWGHLEVIFAVGALDIGFGSTTAAAAPKIETSDASSTGYEDLTGAALSAVFGADDDDTMRKIDIDLMHVAHKRYIRVNAPTAGDGSAGVNACIIGRLSDPQGLAPDTAAKRGLAEHVITGTS